MKNEMENKQDKMIDEPVVIPDECGDTMWDKVLLQDEIKAALNNSVNNQQAS